MNLIQQFKAMVVRLFKKHHFYPQYEPIIHACMGIASEVNELRAAILADDLENLTEELGDITFYYEAAIIEFLYLSGYKQTDVDNAHKNFISIDVDLTNCNNTLDMLNYIADNSCMAFDEIKRGWVYGKNISYSPLLTNLVKIIKFTEHIATLSGISKQEILEHNMNKLEHVDTGRYKEKVYSDRAAIDRRDKK